MLRYVTCPFFMCDQAVGREMWINRNEPEAPCLRRQSGTLPLQRFSQDEAPSRGLEPENRITEKQGQREYADRQRDSSTTLRS